ncbi:MAG TPA: exodeoxyribonuclease III [Pseudomonadota bacterium]|nr:exodeoxyribonuclease III [Pseudomonadota bacterium]
MPPTTKPGSPSPRKPDLKRTERPDVSDCFSVVTWNVNSLRMRWDRLRDFLSAQRPDVLCLQEIKMQDADFPVLELRGLGYPSVAHGQKAYNGVAILCREEHGPLTDIVRGIPVGEEDAEARLILASIPSLGVRVGSVYVPNGQAVGTEKYEYKLRWLARLHRYLTEQCSPQDATALCGDFNVAPADCDVHDPTLWADTVICHEAARAAFARLVAVGFRDTLRLVRPFERDGERIFTYWDYRSLAFPKNLGLRIDHILATESLAGRCRWVEVDRQARKGEKPSDHAPVIAWFQRFRRETTA